jgi:hypothetical protein
MAGQRDVIEQFKKDMQTRFNISELGTLKKHLGIWYDWREDDKDEQYIDPTMPKLVKEIIESFKMRMAREVKISIVPGTPGKTLPKAKEEEEAVDPENADQLLGKVCTY